MLSLIDRCYLAQLGYSCNFPLFLDVAELKGNLIVGEIFEKRGGKTWLSCHFLLFEIAVEPGSMYFIRSNMQSNKNKKIIVDFSIKVNQSSTVALDE